jgi:hypothetical protein
MTDAECSVPEPALSVFDARQKEKLLGRRHLLRSELVLLWLIAAICFITIVNHFQTFSAEVRTFGDNGAYMSAAEGIRHWDFNGVQTKQSWGLPYLIAGLTYFHLPAQFSLLFICMAASIGSVLLVRNLLGAWIAAFFTILNFDWFQVSFLGGSEPLFVLLLFASFWASRRGRWLLASVLAALATLVRPVGLFALLAIGLALILRRDYKKTFLCTATAMLIGMLYLLPFWIYFHDPLYQFHRYKQADWQSGFVISWPFHAIVWSFLHNREPWTNVIFTVGWIGFAALGLYKMCGRLYRQQLGEHSNEYIFAISYLIFLYCYNSDQWARAEFPRFVIPVLPFLLLAFVQWLPKSRFVVYALCVLSSVLGACSAIGIRNVIAALH